MPADIRPEECEETTAVLIFPECTCGDTVQGTELDFPQLFLCEHERNPNLHNTEQYKTMCLTQLSSLKHTELFFFLSA